MAAQIAIRRQQQQEDEAMEEKERLAMEEEKRNTNQNKEIGLKASEPKDIVVDTDDDGTDVSDTGL